MFILVPINQNIKLGKKVFVGVFISLVLFGSKAYARKDTICITIRPSVALGNDADASISSLNYTTNYGTSTDFFSDTWRCSGPLCLDRSLIQFNLSSIPSTATILNATLWLYADTLASQDISGEPTYGPNNAGWLQRVTSPWTVNTVTWSNQPTTTATNEVALAQSTSTAQNYIADVSQLIRDIIISGNNYGFELKQQNETNYYQSLIFGSSNNPDTNMHPKIQICYVVDGIDDSCISMRPSVVTGTMISTQHPNLNYGNSSDFFSATWTCGPLCVDRGLIQFDLSSIPGNAVITNASLSLYVDNNAPEGITGQPTYGTNNAGWLQRVTSAWASNTVTWNTQPTTTTTNEITLAQSTGTSENYTLDVTQLIKDILIGGYNYGFEILQQNETTPYQSLIFGASVNTDSTIRPKLDICYYINLTTALSQITGESLNIEVYPNPASNAVVFKTSADEKVKDFHVEMYNEMGQEVRNFQLFPYQVTINTSDLSRGLYFYRIIGESTVIKSGKIILY